MNNFFKRNNDGFGMLEVVVGVAIISFSLFSLVAVAQISMRLNEETSNNTKAAFLLEEGVEAVKIMRDTSWQNISLLTPGASYYLNFNGATWATTTTNTFVDGLYERKFIITDVNRDANQDIATSGGSNDANTKKITISVSWRARNATTTRTISTYITNMFN